MIDVASVIVTANKYIVGAFLDMVGAVIQGAADAFGWIPGLGSKLRQAATDFDGLKTGVNNAFNSMLGTLGQWKAGLEDNKNTTANVTASIQADRSEEH